MAAAENSFDIVSTVDLQEVRNAVQQAEKEIGNRYDLKKAAAELTLEGEEIVPRGRRTSTRSSSASTSCSRSWSSAEFT